MIALQWFRWLAVAWVLVFAGRLWAAEIDSPAILLNNAQSTPLVAVTRTGQRWVAVGDHGVIVHSDDGRVWNQSKSVPVDGLLTALSFADDRQGWAVGHNGVVLHSDDSGQTWVLQKRLDDQPTLLSVWFENARHGMVVGAYGYAAQTLDGGATWQAMQVGEEGEDHHLNALFAGRDGTLFIAAESGKAYRSSDHGATWQSLDTGVSGSLWGGTGLRDGRLLLVGMSGRVLVGDSSGRHWQRLDSGSHEAITAVTQLNDGRVAWVGNGGLVGRSDTAVEHFFVEQREDRLNLCAVAANTSGDLLLFGPTGVIVPDAVPGAEK